MPEERNWEGKSRGGLLGHRIFVFTLRTFGLRTAYFLLRFVATWFFLTAKSTKTSLKYFRQIHGYKTQKAYAATWRNYFLFGQTLIDKVAILAGLKTKYSIEHEGHNNLQHIKQRGSILLSAHIGNWEIAGQMLEVLDSRFNILLLDNEIERMKAYMNKVMGKKKFKTIPIREDMSHLIELHNAFANKELVVMHGDRFLPGTATIEKDFMGKKAKFPAGPFVMAAKFGVPITVVFALKEGRTRYHFYAKEPIEVKRSRTKEEVETAVKTASDQYVAWLEEMVKKYPTQWFNFYDFWENK